MVAPYAASPASPPMPGGDPTAVFGRRIVAFLIDSLLLVVPALLLLSASFEYLEVSQLDRDPEAYCNDYMDEQGGFCLDMSDVDDRVYFSDGPSSGSTLLFWGGSFLLLVVVQGITGWTVGKLVMGLRTVQEDGRPAGVGRAFLRWILLVVDMLPCIGLVGLITAGTSTGHRRVGDLAAKTYVVRAAAAGSPIRIPGTASASAPLSYGDGGWPQSPPPPGTGWGQPVAPTPTAWGQPEAPAAPSSGDAGWAAPGAPAAPPAPSAPAPQWDEARGTYIQWDPSQSRWLQWNEGARTWDVIPGQ